jgi:hypothetical protein
VNCLANLDSGYVLDITDSKYKKSFDVLVRANVEQWDGTDLHSSTWFGEAYEWSALGVCRPA